MPDPYLQIAVACGSCIIVFVVSHLIWQWRHKRADCSLAIFWERPLAVISILLFVAKYTDWSLDWFGGWLIFSYLLCLTVHTICLRRIVSKGHAHQKNNEQPTAVEETVN